MQRREHILGPGVGLDRRRAVDVVRP
jgi:hypothetical protein